MSIITINREFGSGGRELGKRLADALGIPCYDREIIDMVAKQKGINRDYVSHISEKDIRIFYSTTIARRFATTNPITQQSVDVYVAQQKILRELASQSSCVIVGRAADVVLKDMNPINLFIYADEESKIARCKQRATENEKLTDKEIMKKMKQIDKGRAAHHALFADTKWGDVKSYHLCINTSGKDIKLLIPAISDYIRCWFKPSI